MRSFEERLRAAVDLVVPADTTPSAAAAGVVEFWSEVLAGERPEWRSVLDRVLDALDAAAGGPLGEASPERQRAALDELSDDPDYVWFATTVNNAYYASPASWPTLGWHPEPVGGWPDVVVPGLERGPVIRRDQLQPRYDAIVVGSGAGGGVAAGALAEAGRRVLLVERGDFPDPAYLARDLLRNARTDTGLDHRTLARRGRTRAPC